MIFVDLFSKVSTTTVNSRSIRLSLNDVLYLSYRFSGTKYTDLDANYFVVLLNSEKTAYFRALRNLNDSSISYENNEINFNEIRKISLNINQSNITSNGNIAVTIVK